MDQIFQALTGANAGTGWQLQGDAGFYIHRGTVYLQGEIAARTSPLPGTTLLTGLPAETRPSSPVSVTLQADRFAGIDAATPGITLPVTFAATANPDGTLVLDALPPYADTAPASPPYEYWVYNAFSGWVSAPDFTDPFSYTVVLGDARWPVALETDAPAVWTSFAPLLAGGDFTDIDSEYAVHDARIHLRGRVQATVDDASLLTSSLPGLLSAGLSASADSYAIAEAPSDAAVLEIAKPSIIVESAYDGRPATPYIGTDNIHHAPAPVAGLRPWPRVSGPPGLPDTSWLGFPIGFFGGDPTIYQAATATWEGPVTPCGIFHCDLAGGGSILGLSVDGLLDLLYPAPEWFMVSVNVVPGGLPVSAIETHPHSIGCVAGDCGPAIFSARYRLDVGAGDIMTGLISGGTWTGSAGGHIIDISQRGDGTWPDVPGTSFPFGSAGQNPPGGWIARGSGADTYGKDPTNPNSTLLWQRGEIDSIEQRIFPGPHSGRNTLVVGVTPYYIQKEDYLKAADMLTLDGAGWQNPFSASTVPITPSQVTASGQSSGIVRAGA